VVFLVVGALPIAVAAVRPILRRDPRRIAR